ncbi:MAG TPA: hypothetical protein VL171_06135 [Verrucomicrobiae bacterium]|nr:hypothetical protein [Verrucomicrobiae bacterium]
MNDSPRSLYVRIAVVALLLSWGVAIPARRATAADATTPPQQAVLSAESETTLLSQAYNILVVANHDYKGHRVRAMKQIEAAAKLLGVTLQGNGKGHEQQPTSDTQLRQAQTLLQQLSTGLAPTKPKAVHAHIEAAIKQINLALAIK